MKKQNIMIVLFWCIVTSLLNGAAASGDARESADTVVKDRIEYQDIQVFYQNLLLEMLPDTVNVRKEDIEQKLTTFFTECGQACLKAFKYDVVDCYEHDKKGDQQPSVLLQTITNFYNMNQEVSGCSEYKLHFQTKQSLDVPVCVFSDVTPEMRANLLTADALQKLLAQKLRLDVDVGVLRRVLKVVEGTRYILTVGDIEKCYEQAVAPCTDLKKDGTQKFLILVCQQQGLAKFDDWLQEEFVQGSTCLEVAERYGHRHNLWMQNVKRNYAQAYIVNLEKKQKLTEGHKSLIARCVRSVVDGLFLTNVQALRDFVKQDEVAIVQNVMGSKQPSETSPLWQQGLSQVNDLMQCGQMFLDLEPVTDDERQTMTDMVKSRYKKSFQDLNQQREQEECLIGEQQVKDWNAYLQEHEQELVQWYKQDFKNYQKSCYTESKGLVKEPTPILRRMNDLLGGVLEVDRFQKVFGDKVAVEARSVKASTTGKKKSKFEEMKQRRAGRGDTGRKRIVGGSEKDIQGTEEAQKKLLESEHENEQRKKKQTR